MRSSPVMHGEVVPVRVTVVIPAHDEEEYIGRAIRSVLDQDTSGVEILVVDDHSTDRTASIARSFPGVRVVSNPGRGVVDALNHGLDTALGDIVVRLDADDVSLAGGVKNLAAALDLHPAASLAVGRAVFVDRAGNRIAEHGIVPDRASMRVVSMAINPIVHSAVAYRRAHVVALGGYRCDDTTEVAQDFDLWSRLLEAGDVVVVPVEVAEQWFWPTSTTSRRVAEQRRRAIGFRRRNLARWSAARA
ncbi:MAG: glycosyltransferase, partial [Ilumatobacteraceae bacterium]